MKRNFIIPGLIILLCFNYSNLTSQIVQKDVSELQKIDVIEHLGEKIPLSLNFTGPKGEEIPLGALFKEGKPVLLTMAYYECPMLCTFVLNGLSKGIADLDFLPGEDFQMITISIDPGETWQLAAGKKANQTAAVGKSFPEDGWEFLVGPKESSERLANALGFKYYYDEERDEYAHPAVSFVLTEDGMITRYLYGIEYRAQDLRLALLEASEGRIGNTFDKILLYCYHYDPEAGGYVIFAGNVMRIGGVITMILLGGTLGIFWYREVRRRTRTADEKHA